jgi:hypothetical protein
MRHAFLIVCLIATMAGASMSEARACRCFTPDKIMKICKDRTSGRYSHDFNRRQNFGKTLTCRAAAKYGHAKLKHYFTVKSNSRRNAFNHRREAQYICRYYTKPRSRGFSHGINDHREFQNCQRQLAAASKKMTSARRNRTNSGSNGTSKSGSKRRSWNPFAPRRR